MKTKVSLREIVGTKIIYAVLLASYYWMWARRDWHDFYMTIQNGIGLFTVLFVSLQTARIRRYSKEEKDELAISNLRRVDAIGLKVMTAAAAVIAFAACITGAEGRLVGYALVGMILALSVIRFVLFCVMDSKGV